MVCPLHPPAPSHWSLAVARLLSSQVVPAVASLLANTTETRVGVSVCVICGVAARRTVRFVASAAQPPAGKASFTRVRSSRARHSSRLKIRFTDTALTRIGQITCRIRRHRTQYHPLCSPHAQPPVPLQSASSLHGSVAVVHVTVVG